MSDTLTPNEVAELCKVGRDSVMAWIHSGELPAVDVRSSRKKLGGKPRYRIDRAELDAFWKRRRVLTPPKSEPRRKAMPGVIQFIK